MAHLTKDKTCQMNARTHIQTCVLHAHRLTHTQRSESKSRGLVDCKDTENKKGVQQWEGEDVPDSLGDVVNILGLDDGVQVVLQDAHEVVLQLAPSEVGQDLLPVRRILHPHTPLPFLKPIASSPSIKEKKRKQITENLRTTLKNSNTLECVTA